MQDLKEYIENRYLNNIQDFLQTEVKEQMYRVNKVISNRNYLNGNHKILERANATWKGEEFKTTKLILNNIKSILNFHDAYLLGKPISLNGSDRKVKIFNNIYKKAHYHKLDFDIKRKINRYGDCFEYIYYDKSKQAIQSKIINSENGFPVFNEYGDYVGFIEHYKVKQIEYYYIYYHDRVEQYDNRSGVTKLVNANSNVSGLPIHYKSYSDDNERFGESFIKEIRPIIDALEDLLSKMTDAVYTLSLNPLAVSVGQKLEGNIDSDLVGSLIELDCGEFKFANANMDYSTIKLLLDSLEKNLSVVASMPSVALGNSNISNVSEESLSMLYNLAEAKAMLDEKSLREGFEERWEKIEQILSLQKITFEIDEYIDCEFNYSKPINKNELMNSLEKQYSMGAISKQSIIEKSGLTNNVQQELERLKQENQGTIINSDSEMES